MEKVEAESNFPKKLESKKPANLKTEDWVKLICQNCRFYHPEEKEKLECAGFKILKKLVLKGELQIAGLVEAAKEIDKE